LQLKSEQSGSRAALFFYAWTDFSLFTKKMVCRFAFWKFATYFFDVTGNQFLAGQGRAVRTVLDKGKPVVRRGRKAMGS